MAATSSYMASTNFSMSGPIGGAYLTKTQRRHGAPSRISAQQQQPTPPPPQQLAVDQEEQQQQQQQTMFDDKTSAAAGTPLRPVEVQRNVKSKNMGREYGGQWLSSTTRHVRIFAAYIDPKTWEFDQTQMDKLTLILDPTNEFVWNPVTTNKVFSYFQELVDHYEGAPLTEYTLRLIGSDIEHYIRKLLYDGEIKYNMNARVLNFSMGKPRILFNNTQDPQFEDV